MVYKGVMDKMTSSVDSRTDPTPEEIQEAKQAYGTLTGEGLVLAMRACKAQQDALEEMIDSSYRPIILDLLSIGAVAQARQVVLSRVPDSVTRVFLLDLVRQHQKALDNLPAGVC
jgi:hypothetical protein